MLEYFHTYLAEHHANILYSYKLLPLQNNQLNDVLFWMKLGKAKANYVDANTMTRQVGIWASTRVSDGQGGYTTTFALQTTVWGDLRPDNQVREVGESELS